MTLSLAFFAISIASRSFWVREDVYKRQVHSVVYDLTDKTALWVPNEHFGEADRIQHLTLAKDVYKRQPVSCC